MESTSPSSAESHSPFRQSLPLLITSLVNKSGSIGISLLPMLLVEGHYSTAESSLAMTCVKSTTVVGTLLSGWAGDSLGLRFTLLASFALSALGFLFLPFQLGLAALIFAGMIAQLGNTSTNGTIRLLLVKLVERQNQKVALGWMRTVNNLGQILSYGVAASAATIGMQLLIWFDSLTSFLALIIGIKSVPRDEIVSKSSSPSETMSTSDAPSGWWPFLGATLLLTSWTFIYEFYISGVAGKLKVVHPEEGLRIFSLLMVLNTVICALLAVKAARLLKHVNRSMALAATLTSAGLVIAVLFTDSIPMLFLAAFCQTLGEVIYGVFGQFLLIRLVPKSSRPNTLYSAAILVANLGRLTAAAIAFPLIIRATSPIPSITLGILTALGSFLVIFLGRKRFEAATADTRF